MTLEQLEEVTDSYGRCNIAQALATTAPPQGRFLLEKMIRRKEGWVTAYALDALIMNPRAEDLALVSLAYAGESHEFIKVHAVKAAGFVPSASSIQFLMDRMAHYAPIDSVLEFGCNSGPNLYHVARRFPGARVNGVDISAGALSPSNAKPVALPSARLTAVASTTVSASPPTRRTTGKVP